MTDFDCCARAVCPECEQGKTANCTGWALNDHDDMVPCTGKDTD